MDNVRNGIKLDDIIAEIRGTMSKILAQFDIQDEMKSEKHLRIVEKSEISILDRFDNIFFDYGFEFENKQYHITQAGCTWMDEVKNLTDDNQTIINTRLLSREIQAYLYHMPTYTEQEKHQIISKMIINHWDVLFRHLIFMDTTGGFREIACSKSEITVIKFPKTHTVSNTNLNFTLTI